MQQDEMKQIEQAPAAQDQTVTQEQEMKQKPETKQTEQKPDCPKPDLTQKPIVKKFPSKCWNMLRPELKLGAYLTDKNIRVTV